MNAGWTPPALDPAFAPIVPPTVAVLRSSGAPACAKAAMRWRMASTPTVRDATTPQGRGTILASAAVARVGPSTLAQVAVAMSETLATAMPERPMRATGVRPYVLDGAPRMPGAPTPARTQTPRPAATAPIAPARMAPVVAMAPAYGAPAATVTPASVGPLTSDHVVAVAPVPRGRAGFSAPAAPAAPVGRHGDRVIDDMPGVGPLAPLIRDPRVTDVLVNRGEVWVDRGNGLVRADVVVGSPADVRRLAQRLANACGRRLDEASPFVDASLPDGTRLHAVLPPVATQGPYLSLRTFRHRAFSLAELVELRSLTEFGADLLAAIVAARLPYVVSGGTGTGKTTILGTMLGLVPRTERIVLVEDSPELRPDHPHVVGLSTRTANVEGAGTVTLRDLMRQALRMRPDRVVIGECRGRRSDRLTGRA